MKSAHLFLALILLPLALSAQVNWTSRNPSPNTPAFRALAAGQGIYAAVTESGTVVTSADSLTWQTETFPTAENLVNLAFANGRFFARGYSGTIFVSDDGHYWLQRLGGGVSTSGGPTGRYVVYGNGLYVALSSYNGTIVTSPDTVTWTVLPSVYGDSIAFGNGLFVMSSYSNRSLSTSTDGLTWTPIATGDLQSADQVTFGVGRFVARREAKLYQSEDGLTWTLIAGVFAKDVVFVKDRFLARDSTSNATITSLDGLAWTTQAGATAPVTPSQVAGIGDSFVGFAGSKFYRSSDAVTWSTSGTSFSTTAYFPGIAFAQNRFLTGNGYLSSDGIAWTTGGFAVPENLAQNAVVQSANDRFFALAGGAVYLSLDGLTGTKTADLAFTARAVAFGNGRYVIVGGNSDASPGGVATSDNGVNWTDRSTTVALRSLVDVRYGGTFFTAISRDGTIYTSPDGLAWTLRPHPATSVSANALAYGAGRWVIAGDPSLTSTDGITWSAPRTIPDGDGIAYANGVFVMAPYGFSTNNAALNPSSMVATSPDGLHWTYRPTGSLTAHTFAFGHGSWVSSTNNGRIIQSPAADLPLAPAFAVGLSAAFDPADDNRIILDAPASGPGPVTYQWYRAGALVAGANSSSFTLVNWRDYSNQANYTVVATNAAGSASYPYRIPFQSRQLRPDDTGLALSGVPTADGRISLKLGNSSVFSPLTLGPGPLSFQWYKDGVAIPNTDAQFITIPYDSATDLDSIYTVALTNLWGRVSFDYDLLPKFLVAPASFQANPGDSTYLSIRVTAPIAGGNITFTWKKDGVVYSTHTVSPGNWVGATIGESLSFPSVKSSDYGAYQLVVTNSLGSTTSETFTFAPPPVTRLVNLSVRAHVGTGDDVLIAGFVGSGSSGGPNVLIRGIGPALGALGVAAPLPRAHLGFNNSAGVNLLVNDHWDATPGYDAAYLRELFAQLGAFALTAGSADAAIVRPGALNTDQPPRFTAALSGVDNTTGVGLIEVYEASASAQRLVNLSARARVGTGENVLIAGFVVAGDKPIKLLIRGVGPTLATQGVGSPLANPKIILYNSAGTEIHNNDQWSDARNLADLRAATAASGAFALNEGGSDAAMLETLAPGVYSVHVTSVGGSSGVALVEIYEVP